MNFVQNSWRQSKRWCGTYRGRVRDDVAPIHWVSVPNSLNALFFLIRQRFTLQSMCISNIGKFKLSKCTFMEDNNILNLCGETVCVNWWNDLLIYTARASIFIHTMGPNPQFGNMTEISKVWFYLCRWVAWMLTRNFLLGECHRNMLMRSQHRLR